MKKHIQYFFRTILRCFIPVKNRGTIGTIQRTLVISNWTFLLLVIISIILEMIKKPCDNWTSFFETFAIGSACSIVIVIVTTIIQFVSLRNDKAKFFIRQITNISEKLFCVKTEYASEKEEVSKPFVENLKKTVNSFTRDFEELYWFNGEIDDLYSAITLKLFKIGIKLSSDPAYAYNLNSKEIKEIILKSNQLITIVNPKGMNYLDGVVGAIKNGDLSE